MVSKAQRDSLKTDASETLARLVEVLTLNASDLVAKTTMDAWLKGQTDGKFADISYPEQNAGTNIQPLEEHLGRIGQLASFASTQAETQRELYYDGAIQALVFYAESDFNPKNWWQRQIGLAKHAATGLVLLAEAKGADKLGPVVSHLQATSMLEPKSTGANRADIAYIQLLWAIAGWKATADDACLDHALAASEAMSALCMPVTLDGPEQGEGIRMDYSFSQHNPVRDGQVYSQLYAGSYGAELVDRIFQFMDVVAGNFSLKPESVNSIMGFLNKGIGYFAYKSFYDFHVCGRSISRGAPEVWGWERWEQILKKLYPKKYWNYPPTGCRAFPLNDYMSHFYYDFAVFTRTVSTRTVGTETGNGENLKGYHLGCGSFFLVASGEEYKNIQPIWDWQHIPGTTVEQVPNFVYPLMEWGKDAWGSHDFSGVMSDSIPDYDYDYGGTGDFGIASMQLTKDNIVNARKSVITLPDAVICLGNAGDLSKTKHPVHTTINQCWLIGDVTVELKDGTTKTITERFTSQDINEVRHNGFRYSFRHITQSVTVDIGNREGSWHGINSGMPDTLISGMVFSIWINHPPTTTSDYCCEIRMIDDSNYNLDIVLTRKMHGVRYQHRHWKTEQGIGSIFEKKSEHLHFTSCDIQLAGLCVYSARYDPDSKKLRLHLVDFTKKQNVKKIRVNHKNRHVNYSLHHATNQNFITANFRL